MSEKAIIFNNLLNFRLTLEIIYTSIFYVATFAFPVIAILFFQSFKTQKNKWIPILSVAIIAVASFFFSEYLTRFAKEFPFVENTFTRKGFFPGELTGNKYHMRGFYDIFNAYQILGALSMGLLITTYLNKKRLSIYSILFILYLGIMLIAPKIYDRYYIPLILFGLLEISTQIDWNKVKNKLLLAQIPILFIATIISYQFFMDFVTTQIKIWSYNDLNTEKSRAYNNYNDGQQNTSDYQLSYDKSENIVDTINLDFPFSLFINPVVYINKK